MGLKDMLKVCTVVTLPFLAMAAVDTAVREIIGNPYNMKSMPQVQPWIWLYDTEIKMAD